MGPSGAAELFTKVNKHRIVRHIGFSAHGVEAAKVLMEGMQLDWVCFR
jgi:predicted aldo/keto reductase-like oxidoreductase